MIYHSLHDATCPLPMMSQDLDRVTSFCPVFAFLPSCMNPYTHLPFLGWTESCRNSLLVALEFEGCHRRTGRHPSIHGCRFLCVVTGSSPRGHSHAIGGFGHADLREASVCAACKCLQLRSRVSWRLGLTACMATSKPEVQLC